MTGQTVMSRDAIFDQFTPYTGVCEPDTVITWIGTKLLGEWKSLPPHPLYNRTVPEPQVGEEYFEWIDLLQAVLDSMPRGRFTMLDLGAGTGRWGINAILAARQKHIKHIDVRFVEAEPQHFQWLMSAFSMNDIHCPEVWRPAFNAAISYHPAPVKFLIGNGKYHAANWYGQYIENIPADITTETYCGHNVLRAKDTDCPKSFVWIGSITPEEVALDLPVVDYVDMDLQGAELNIVQNSMPFLNQKVRRIHIGTHGEKVEQELRQAFTRHNWKCVWDFPGHRTNETPYGPVEFQDGVQSWINTKL